ncbi:MAG: OstA-like protein, partial [Bacteroidota bacterium]
MKAWLPWLFLALLSLLGTRGRAQGVVSDTTVREVVNIDRADELRMLNQGETQLLIGNVELSQDSIFMYGDSVILVASVQVNAYDNVTIQQGDSLAAFSDELDYNAATRLADLTGNVVLQRGDMELFTDRLAYNLTTKLATYHTGGRIVTDSTELRSTHGYYYADRQQVYFRDSVVVVDDRFEMRADTLLYDHAVAEVNLLPVG